MSTVMSQEQIARAAEIVAEAYRNNAVIDQLPADCTPETVADARTSWVFNASQVDGWSPPKPPERSEVEVLVHAEAFVERTGAVIRHGGDSACYRSLSDVIDMPDRDLFKGTTTSGATESYYAVLFHELTHWTGHQSRLDRQLANRFGDAAYAMEELVAELGASFLCADNAIANEPRPDHACYIAN